MRSREDKAYACLRVEMVQRQTIMHYQPAGKVPFLKIVLASPNLVPKAKCTLWWLGLWAGVAVRVLCVCFCVLGKADVFAVLQ